MPLSASSFFVFEVSMIACLTPKRVIRSSPSGCLPVNRQDSTRRTFSSEEQLYSLPHHWSNG